MNSVSNQPIVLSVTQLTQAIKLQLEATFPLVWVRGEVSNIKTQSSGHIYFSLKDEDAQIAAVAFRPDAQKIALIPKNGDQVLVRAEMNVWPPRGGYQLVVRELSHVGQGELLLKIELLKKKLSAKGYFAAEHKQQLPKFPKRIGIITSPTGAVLHDMINILSRRMSGFHLIVYPVKVQGDGASEEIAKAIYDMNAYNLVDVLVVCRGGGSFEDLAPFNSEIVATAIFNSKIPIVSAVGHETDISISDFVADVRAPTPSAAAELISHEEEALRERLSKYRKNFSQVLSAKIHDARKNFTKCTKHPLLLSATALLAPRWQALDEKKDDLDAAMMRKVSLFKKELMQLERAVRHVRPSRKIQEQKQILTQLEKQLAQAIARVLADKKQKLVRVESILHSIHPKKLLTKGYSILFSQKDGSVIESKNKVNPDDAVRIMLHDGSIDAIVTKVE